MVPMTNAHPVTTRSTPEMQRAAERATERRTGGIRLRPYQTECVDTLMRGLHAPRPEDSVGEHPHLAAVLPTGAGKTVIFSALGDAWHGRHPGEPVMVLAHRDELITQAAAKYRNVVPDAKIGVIKAERHEVAGREVVVASVQSLNARRRERLGKWRPSLLVIDECFPAGTIVGTKPIESIKAGDFVPSYDEGTGDLVLRRVIATMRRTPSAMVRVRLADGRSFECTPNHPLMTTDGWCPAGLSRGAYVLSFTHDTTAQGTDRADLRRVRGDLHGTAQGEDRRSAPVRPRLLPGLVPGCMGSTLAVADDGGYQSSARLGPDEGEQSDASRGLARGDEGNAGADRTPAARAGWERLEAARSTEALVRFLGVAYRGDRSAERRWAAVSLQAGYRTPDDDGLRGGGWGIPLLAGAPRIGHASGRAACFSRVVDVQVLEPGRDGTYGGVCRDGAVYNLEVEGTHTYLINEGLLVHNCHHSTAKSYRDVIAWAGCPVVGVTATMSRTDGKALGRAAGGIFDEIVYQKSILWMIRQGYLCDVKGHRVVVEDLDLTGMRKVGGDYSDGQVSERLLGSSAPEAVAEAVTEYSGGQPGVIFAPTVESAQAFTEAMRAAGFSCETVWGAMPLDRDVVSPLGIVEQKSRRRVLREFNLGKIDWLSNCMVLTEGFDAPRAKVAVIARATQSASLYVQMVGRVLRPFPGAMHALVLDVVGATAQHELATLAVLGGDRPKDVEGKTLLDLYGTPCDYCMTPADECEWETGEACCEDCSHRPAETDRDELVAPTLIKAIDADLFAGSRQQWLQTYAGYWFLPAGDRVIAIAPRPGGEPVLPEHSGDGEDECAGCSCHLGYAPCSHCEGCWEDQPDGYDVIWAWQDRRGGDFLVRAVPDLGYAMAQGEASITVEEEVLARKAGAWRKRKATEKQISYCRSLGIFRDEMTSWRAGQVADEISRRKASARVDKMITKRIEG